MGSNLAFSPPLELVLELTFITSFVYLIGLLLLKLHFSLSRFKEQKKEGKIIEYEHKNEKGYREEERDIMGLSGAPYVLK